MREMKQTRFELVLGLNCSEYVDGYCGNSRSRSSVEQSTYDLNVWTLARLRGQSEMPVLQLPVILRDGQADIFGGGSSYIFSLLVWRQCPCPKKSACSKKYYINHVVAHEADLPRIVLLKPIKWAWPSHLKLLCLFWIEPGHTSEGISEYMPNDACMDWTSRSLLHTTYVCTSSAKRLLSARKSLQIRCPTRPYISKPTSLATW